jgi:two-component system chemotaxis response regulator CheB
LINFCRPAVDPLFSSAAQVWGVALLAIILTGMGSDGVHGAENVVAAGGTVMAQDEATSVVWGMPGAAANAGVCSAVLPLGEIGPKIVRLFRGDRS